MAIAALTLGCVNAAASNTPQPAPGYASRADVRLFAEQVSERQGWPLDWTLQALSKARPAPAVARLIMPPPPGQPKNWAAYRQRFVEPSRLKAGLAFWSANERLLRRAEQAYGVPAWLIVGIIGVETYYGRNLGGFRALDALATLSFDFPSGRSDRSGFFREELESLLAWSRREGRPLSKVMSSYAGAIGWPQFMPSSILKFAVDFDGDGRVDLEGNMADVIGSVAHFLKAHGWTPGMPTHYRVEPPSAPGPRATLLEPDILPSFTPDQMRELGAVLEEAALRHAGPLALVEVENGGAPPSHVAGTQNFFVVTRYNRSSYYALAVIELGQALHLKRTKAAGNRPRRN